MGGMGAISNALARSAEAGGRNDSHRGRGRLDRHPRRPRSWRTLTTGESLRAPIVASGAHPKTTILDLAGEEHFPADVAADMRRYRTRGGSVKINMVLSEPLRYEGVSPEEAGLLLTTGVNLCPSIDYLERAWQDATLGRPAENPYVEAELRSAVDGSLTDDGRFVMTMFTQYGPPSEDAWAGDARERYADACIAHLARYAPNGPTRSSSVRCWPCPTSSGSSGWSRARSSRGSRASTRWPSCAQSPRWRSTPRRWTACTLRRRDPPRRRRDGRLRPQRGPADPARPALPSAAPALTHRDLSCPALGLSQAAVSRCGSFQPGRG